MKISLVHGTTHEGRPSLVYRFLPSSRGQLSVGPSSRMVRGRPPEPSSRRGQLGTLLTSGSVVEMPSDVPSNPVSWVNLARTYVPGVFGTLLFLNKIRRFRIQLNNVSIPIDYGVSSRLVSGTRLHRVLNENITDTRFLPKM